MRSTLLTLIALISMQAPAAQASSSHLTMNGTGSLGVSGTADAPKFTLNFSGTASVDPFGSGSVQASGIYQPASNSSLNGQFTITFSAGSTVTGTFIIPGSAFSNSTSATGISLSGSSVTITSGTGAYANVSGSFSDVSGDLTRTGFADPATQSFPLILSFDGQGTVNSAGSGGSATAMRFVPVTPCRLADTRNADGAFGGPVLQGQTSRNFNPRQSSCNIPQSAGAYALNVTVVPRGSLGYVSMWPAGQSQPGVSTLNSLDGRIKANAAIVPAGQSGAISVFATDTTDVVLDINGYFEAAAGPNDLVFYPVTPCRVVDTRTVNGGTVRSGQSKSFDVQNTPCGPFNGAQAYSLNVTVVPTQPLGYLTMWPSGGSQPYVSTLNAPTGTIVANAAIVPAGSNGAISVFATDNTEVVIDINGYFAPPTGNGLQFYPLNPCRVVDTRNANGPFGGPALMEGSPVTYPMLTSSCGIPTAAQAYSLNATVVPPGSLGYLTLWPANQSQPLVSTLNATDGAITGNAAIVPAGGSGAISAFGSNNTHLILDINGYFAP